MPNMIQHILIGAFGSLGVAIVLLGLKVPEGPVMVPFLIASFIGSVLPDRLEPGGPGKWNHRKKFHSWKTFWIMSKIAGALFIASLVEVFVLGGLGVLFSVFSFFLGYILHLAADSRTTMGLPKK